YARPLGSRRCWCRWSCRRSRLSCRFRGRRWGMSMRALSGLNYYIDAFFILPNHRQSAARSLQQGRKIRLDKAMLLFRVAHMPVWWSHVHHATHLTFEKRIIATQMNFGGLARSLQLFQVTVAELVLFVALVADRLRVGDSLRNGWRCS